MEFRKAAERLHRNRTIVFIVGPTAVGKSEIAVWLARKLNGEIISADSMQVYRGMDIGTAKPGKRLCRAVRHHLIDILEPSTAYSAFRFRTLALKKIGEIHRRGKIPFIVGGSGLYVRALLRGLEGESKPDPALRRNLQTVFQREGLPAMVKNLEQLDPAGAMKVDKKNARRVLRALEILMTGEEPLAKRSQQQKSLKDLGYQPVLAGINFPRARLYERINQRIDRMFRQGWVPEVRRLLKKKIGITAKQALGYRELILLLALKLTKKEEKGKLSQIREIIKQQTRRFAKRQQTWFRKEEGIHWFSIEGFADTPDAAAHILNWMVEQPDR